MVLSWVPHEAAEGTVNVNVGPFNTKLTYALQLCWHVSVNACLLPLNTRDLYQMRDNREHENSWKIFYGSAQPTFLFTLRNVDFKIYNGVVRNFEAFRRVRLASIVCVIANICFT